MQLRFDRRKAFYKKNVPKMDYEKVVPLWAQYMRVHRARIEFATIH